MCIRASFSSWSRFSKVKLFPAIDLPLAFIYKKSDTPLRGAVIRPYSHIAIELYSI